MADRSDEQAERLERAIEDARELLRDINSASKDLRRTLRETRDLLATDIAARLEGEVRDQLDKLGETTEKQMRISVEKVIGEFDKLGAILLGVDRAEPLEDMVRKVAANPGRNQIEPYDTSVTYDIDALERHP